MARILIVGGGVSGLSAGIYARLCGHDAQIFELHSIAGGNLTGWNREGCHIDNCIHWLTGTNPATHTYKMWRELGALGDVEVIQTESLFTCSHEGKTLSLSNNIDKFEEDMLKISPEDRREILSLTRAVRTVQGLGGILGENNDKKCTPMRFMGGAPALVKYYNMSTGELANRFSHPLLRFFFGSLLGDNFGAIFLIFIFAQFCGKNGGIPRGSSLGMARRMSERFVSLGGVLNLSREVVKINLDGHRATSLILSDGSEIFADYIIITGDPKSAFGKYLDLPMPKRLEDQYFDPRLKRFSSYQCAFLCDSVDIPFRGDYIFKTPQKYHAKLGAKNIILREFTHEPSFSPEGKSVIQSLAFTDEITAGEFIRLKENDINAYKVKKEELSKITQMLIEEHFPQFKGRLKCIDVWTPATYKRYTHTEIGSWMSFAIFSRRLPVRVDNRVKGASNIILASQWLQAPGGLPIAAEGGRLAIESINKLESKKVKIKETV